METSPLISSQRLASAYTYSAYRQLIDELLTEGKTTGPKQSEMLTRFTQLNVQRMQRLDKTTVLMPEILAAIGTNPKVYYWLIITEGWCGDAAQIVPVLERIAEASQGKIQTRYVLRDTNLDLIDAHLTKGGRAIPKLVILEADTLEEVAEWGPRPTPAQDLYWSLKEANVPFDELSTQLHTWYAKDKTLSTQAELFEILKRLS
ncbi:thioredoxin family protein [Siphonobacter sp. BAB-5385]|uniref:thioredoxin family protein n=1 Tax=unclassified Siphonobacter TaxID=2635712 RepID=UPI000B9E3CD8|nr:MULTISPECIES: thioredoxin family protein [unclassified Siphonobacter]OZI06738.1 thioredoxin family protein [Siphonobacter sp. BAB-5385]PMD97617.1 thioredoxin family protein [Siphonobacter sp. BAB-5405]